MDEITAELMHTENRVIGTKQAIRALKTQDVRVLFLADDMDIEVREEIFAAVGEKDVHLVYVESKDELGRVCGIDVPCACAAILR